jgi:hypothetical protein
MKRNLTILLAATLAGASGAVAQDFVNFVRQVQVNEGIEYDVQVAANGTQLSPLAIDPGGARFELWTIQQSPLKDFLIDHRYVSAYIPRAYVRIYSEDPYSVIPRTRVDRPFNVEIAVDGLIMDPTAPLAARQVNGFRHVQSYGPDGDGTVQSTEPRILDSSEVITSNGYHVYQFALSAVPGTDRTKVRGEERFVVESLPDYQAPAMQLAAGRIQIWPIASAAITGITEGQKIGFKVPKIELHLDDLYPDSETWAQVYPGSPQLGVQGTPVSGSALVVEDSVPQDRVLRVNNWDKAIDADGFWTLEVLHKTPFGLERLAYVHFHIDRTLEVHGTVTTLE